MAAVAGPSSGGCKQCGGCDCLVEDNSGGMVMLTCHSCGAVVTDQQLVFGGEGQSSGYSASLATKCTLGALSQKVKGRFVDLQKKRERSLLAVIDKMGCDAHIRGAELRTCKEEGIRLLKSIKFHKTKHVAAGLIYLALRRQCLAVTFKEVSQLTGVGMKPLRRSVMSLKRECASSLAGGGIVSDLPFTFQQRIQLMLDQLKVPKKETNEAKKAANDLMEILFGSTENLELHSYCTILIFALDHVYRDKPQAEHWITSVANLVQIKTTTMNNKVSIMKEKLFSAAKKIPSMESRISEKGILRKNINKYIHYILENKSYLISLNKRESKADNESPAITSEDESDIATEPTPQSGDIFPIMLHPSTRSRHRREKRAMVSPTACSGTSQEEERCSDLDDAELDTYLATDREVKKKTHYFRRHHIV